MKNPHDEPAQKFRYREYMERLSVPCPPDDYEPRETIAFRWVFERMKDGQNFVPQFFKHPERFNEMEDKFICQALGLSLFDTAAHAKREFAGLRKYLRSDSAQLGTHLAGGTILPEFGMTNLPNHKGHFTLHPFENIELKEHFEIISTL